MKTAGTSRKIVALFIAFIFAFFVILASVSFALLANRKREILAEIERSAATQTSKVTSYVDSIFDYLATLAVSLGNGTRTIEDDMDSIALLADATQFTLIGIADSNGDGVTSTGHTLNISHRAYFTRAMLGQQSFDYLPDPAYEDVPCFIFALPIFYTNGELGILWAGLDTSNITEILSEESYSSSDTVFVCDSKGNVIVFSSKEQSSIENKATLAETIRGYTVTDNLSAAEILLASRLNDTSFTLSKKGVTEYVFSRPLGLSGLTIYNVASSKRIFSSAKNTIVYLATLVLLLSVLFGAAAYCVYSLERKKSKDILADRERLRQVEEEYTLVGKLSNSVLFEATVPTLQFTFNSQFEEVFGFKPCKLTVGIESTCPHVFASDIPSLFAAVKRVVNEKKTQIVDIRVAKTTDYFWVRMFIAPIVDSNGNTIKLIGKVTQNDEMLKEIETFRFKSEHDELTGIYTRKKLKHAISERLSLSMKNDMHAFVFIDVDNFKSINDTYGHKTGDSILIELAQCLAKELMGRGYFGRLSGDEFVAFFEYVQSTNDVITVCSRLRREFTAACALKGFQNTTISMGVSLWPLDATTIEELLVKADIALYDAKNSGKNTISVYKNDMEFRN